MQFNRHLEPVLVKTEYTSYKCLQIRAQALSIYVALSCSEVHRY